MVPERPLRERYADRGDPIGGGGRPPRLPVALGDDKFDGLEPLPLRRVIAIADADEAVSVLGEKLLRALLARL
jgi:hypothetical protein